MLAITCHCGQIRIQISDLPAYLHDCNCSLCSKLGARWGYFVPSTVNVTGTASRYRRADKPDPAADIQFCPNCGVTTHFTLTETAVARFGNSQMGVNLRLADERDLAGVELRYPDGRGWTGETAFGYVRPPRILGQPGE